MLILYYLLPLPIFKHIIIVPPSNKVVVNNAVKYVALPKTLKTLLLIRNKTEIYLMFILALTMSDRVAQVISEYSKPREDFTLDLAIKVSGGLTFYCF